MGRADLSGTLTIRRYRGIYSLPFCVCLFTLCVKKHTDQAFIIPC